MAVKTVMPLFFEKEASHKLSKKKKKRHIWDFWWDLSDESTSSLKFWSEKKKFHWAMQCFYLDSNIILEYRHYFTFKKFCFAWGKIDEHVTNIFSQSL